MKQTFEITIDKTTYINTECARLAAFEVMTEEPLEDIKEMPLDYIESVLNEWKPVKIVEAETIEDFLESVSAVTGIPVFLFDEEEIRVGNSY